MNQTWRSCTNFGIFEQLAVGHRVPTSRRAWRRLDRLQLQSLRWRRVPRFLRGRGHRTARPDLPDTVANFGTPWVPQPRVGLGGGYTVLSSSPSARGGCRGCLAGFVAEGEALPSPADRAVKLRRGFRGLRLSSEGGQPRPVALVQLPSHSSRAIRRHAACEMCSSAGVGYDRDMRLSVGDGVLTSPVLVWGAAGSTIVQRVFDGVLGERLERRGLLCVSHFWLLFEGPGGSGIAERRRIRQVEASGADSSAFHISGFSSKAPAEAKVQSGGEYAKLCRGRIASSANLTCGITEVGYATALPSLRRT